MYRILTENCNQEGIEELLKASGVDYTAYPAQGSYDGVPEDSFVIDLEQPEEKVMKVAKEIGVLNNQQSVMVEQIPSLYLFVKPEE